MHEVSLLLNFVYLCFLSIYQVLHEKLLNVSQTISFNSQVSIDFVGFVFDCIGFSGYNRNIEFSQRWIQGLSFQSSIMSIKLSLCVSWSIVRRLREHWFAHAPRKKAETWESYR